MSFELHLDTERVAECHPIEPMCLEPAATVAEAIDAMRNHKRGAILVCHEGALVGIFTERDALKLIAAKADFNRPLEDVMTSDPVVLRPSDTVGRAIAMMTRGGYRRLPIVDDRGRPIGMVRVHGILRYLVEHFPATIHNLPPEPHHATQQREGA